MQEVRMVAMTTNELLLLILWGNVVVEASFNAGGFRCTHFLSSGSDGTIFDEGIDGVETPRTSSEFLDLYGTRMWLVEQVVRG